MVGVVTCGDNPNQHSFSAIIATLIQLCDGNVLL